MLTLMVANGDHVCVVDLGILLTTLFMRGYSCQIPPILYLSMNLVDCVDFNGCQGYHVCGIVLGILLNTFMRCCSCQVLPIRYLSLNLVSCVEFNGCSCLCGSSGDSAN